MIPEGLGEDASLPVDAPSWTLVPKARKRNLMKLFAVVPLFAFLSPATLALPSFGTSSHAGPALRVVAPTSEEEAGEDASAFDLEKHFDDNARRAAPRDSFPVFDHPTMLTAEKAESGASPVVRDRDLIIGVAHDGEAKAYPIPVMGTHELGNDTVGGVPIGVSW